jgi:hypothetical protein
MRLWLLNNNGVAQAHIAMTEVAGALLLAKKGD